MVNIKVKNVSGLSNNCFYRCLYHVLHKSGAATCVLRDAPSDAGVEVAALHIREVVADAVRRCPQALTTIDSAWALEQSGPTGMAEMYPFLAHLQGVNTPAERQAVTADAIAWMPLMACSLELDTVNRLLLPRDTILVVLVRDTRLPVDNLIDKWQPELLAILNHTTPTNVGVLVNIDNIHYQYMTFHHNNTWNTIVDRKVLMFILKYALESGSESD